MGMRFIDIRWHEIRWDYIAGLMQKRRNSIGNAVQLHLFCIKPLMWGEVNNG